MRKHIDNFKRFQMNETFNKGTDEVLGDNSTDKDKFIYKMNELTWLKDRFELHMDELTDEDVQKYLDELTKSVNNIHEILNNIRKRSNY